MGTPMGALPDHMKIAVNKALAIEVKERTERGKLGQTTIKYLEPRRPVVAFRPPPEADPLFLALLRRLALPLPVIEHRFDRWEGKGYLFDYAWPDHMLALESDGGIYQRLPSHSSPDNIVRDKRKLNLAQQQGWTVFQVLPNELTDIATIDMLADYLTADELREPSGVGTYSIFEHQSQAMRRRLRLWHIRPHSCCWCKAPMTFETFTVEHLKPKHLKRDFEAMGDYSIETDQNLDIACKKCNNDRDYKYPFPTARHVSKATRKRNFKAIRLMVEDMGDGNREY